MEAMLFNLSGDAPVKEEPAAVACNDEKPLVAAEDIDITDYSDVGGTAAEYIKSEMDFVDDTPHATSSSGTSK